MEDILEILDQLPFSKKKTVLATIIHVEGSAYKREGSCMLIAEDGTQIGMLSAGCLEEDVSWRAKEVLEKDEATVITYDLRDETDLAWGQGSGCNGILSILLQPVNERINEQLMRIKTLLDEGESILHIKRFSKDFKLISEWYCPTNGEPFGDEAFIWNPPEKFPEKDGLFYTDELNHLYIHIYRPRPRLIVFGAGEDAKPLVNIAAEVGFSVTVCDWRPALCNQMNFPNAKCFEIGFPHELGNKLSFTNNDFVILMTHHFHRDKELLSFLKQKDLNYLGVLGPRKRTARLLEEKEVPDCIFSPVGMNIHARGAEEIAISIVAEMIQILREGEKNERKQDYWNLSCRRSE